MPSALFLLICVVATLRVDARHENDVREDDDGDLDDVNSSPIGEVFEAAVRAYLDEDWDGCINGFNQALHGYKTYKRMVINCRRKCRAASTGSSPIFPEDIEDLHFYERKVRETLCLLKCNQDYREIAGAKALKRLTPEVEAKLMDRRVYEYLHICYYQRNRFQDAANAVFTYLIQHPGHENSVRSLRHYLSRPEVARDEVRNLEAAAFVEPYARGVAAYEDEDYAEAARNLEASLELYVEAEEQCRIYCEGSFDQGWHPEFTSSLANHFAYCLKCKRRCPLSLNNLNGEYRKDLMIGHYSYLQFAYYKLGNIKAACEAVGSYLLFVPADETMLHNQRYYSSLPKVTDDYFAPREEAVKYVKRQEYELRLLRFIADEFEAIDARFDKFEKKNKSQKPKKVTPEIIDDLPQGSSSTENAGHFPLQQTDQQPLTKQDEDKEVTDGQGDILSVSREALAGKTCSSKQKMFDSLPNSTKCDTFPQTSQVSNPNVQRERTKKISRRKMFTNFKKLTEIVADEEELGGENRYVADGFLNSTECESLMKLAQVAAVEGDGYDDNKSPHSKYELFEGLTVGRTALMVYLGLLPAELLELFLNSTEAAREHIEEYFALEQPLYFSYTHLVCRTALPESPSSRDDLSHEVHADNCLLSRDGSCRRESPAYTWRDHSAILYLNDDFDGGELFFAVDGHQPRRARSVVRPACGRMVAFTAGPENLHGVRAVRRGTRCALALWFTQQEDYLERERRLARAVLGRVRLLGPIEVEDNDVPIKYEEKLSDYFWQDEILGALLEDPV